MIEVTHGPEPDLCAIERCCFCRKETRYWYKPKDVACCQECAVKAEPVDVPSKKIWCRREDIVRRRIA